MKKVAGKKKVIELTLIAAIKLKTVLMSLITRAAKTARE